MRILFVVIGLIAIVLGCIGIVVPGLPTTPFILLAAWCFYKGSPKMHKWLMNSYFKTYILKYEREQGMTKRSKIIAITMMIIMVLISSFLIVEKINLRIIILLSGLIGLICVVFFVPNAKK